MHGPVDPPDISFECPVFDISFHPLEDFVAVGLIDGGVSVCVIAPASQQHDGQGINGIMIHSYRFHESQVPLRSRQT